VWRSPKSPELPTTVVAVVRFRTIIIYTAHGGRIVEKDGSAAGASTVISKSDDLAVLIGKARELLDRIAA
jgi:hypothetical protein